MIEVAEPEVRTKTPQEVLLAAARYIEEHGWCQHIYGDAEGRACMMGAVLAVTRRSADQFVAPEATPAFRLIDAVLPPRNDGRNPISDYNDAPGRTQAEAVAMLRRAAGQP